METHAETEPIDTKTLADKAVTDIESLRKVVGNESKSWRKQFPDTLQRAQANMRFIEGRILSTKALVAFLGRTYQSIPICHYTDARHDPTYMVITPRIERFSWTIDPSGVVQDGGYEAPKKLDQSTMKNQWQTGRHRPLVRGLAKLNPEKICKLVDREVQKIAKAS